MNIVITGAGKGIGYALTEAFLKDGHRVMAISRNIDKLLRLKNKNLYSFSFDLQQRDYTLLIDKLKDTFQGVDILINNAGAIVNKPFHQLTVDDFDLLFNVNVKAAFKLVNELLPYFNNESHVVNISSMGGVQGSVKFPGLSLYSAAKGALNVLTETMALELADSNISVNALALGAVQTEMLSAAFPGYKAPLEPSEMASFIRDFVLTGHKFFNGKIIPVSLSTP